VVDRQGKPLAGIDIFQSGDGPEPTSTNTNADGRFALGGFCQGSVFLFARGEGFRFFGRLVKPGDQDITIELTRTSERPSAEMKMLPDVIPLEESRALARRFIEPFLQDLEHKSDSEKHHALRTLAMADPAEALRFLEGMAFNDPRLMADIKYAAVRSLARIDPTRAESLAQTIDVADTQAWALLAVADALPDGQRDRKLALLERAADPSRAATGPQSRLEQISELAQRRYESGEKEKAKTLLAEGLRLATELPQKTDPLRGSFAAQLARVDLPSALAIAKDFPASGQYTDAWVLRNIAFHLAADNPAGAERILRQTRPEMGQDWLPAAIAWKLASVDPSRARRLVDESQQHWEHPEMYLFLAIGLKSRDPAAAREAFEIAMRGIDRSLLESEGYTRELANRSYLLPLVEQIDPSLVAEYFWRVVATRPPRGNPRPISEGLQQTMVILLSWYDRAVAAALFEPIRDRMERGDDPRPAVRAMGFLGWCSFDPRAAVARLEQMPVDPKLDIIADPARRQVSEMLGLAHADRWRQIWTRFTDMAGLFERDLR
jgi:hypothetical protein